MSTPKHATPTVSMGSGESQTFSLDYDDGNVQRSDNVAWYGSPPNVITQPNTSAQPNVVIGGYPIGPAGGLGDPDPLACLPSAAHIRCGAGHRAAPECTEYIDGEMISYCAGCGERIILPRVPGAVPLLRLNEFIKAMVALTNGEEIEYDDAKLLFEFAELKAAVAVENEALSRLRSLLDIAERLIRAKLVSSE